MTHREFSTQTPLKFRKNLIPKPVHVPSKYIKPEHYCSFSKPGSLTSWSTQNLWIRCGDHRSCWIVSPTVAGHSLWIKVSSTNFRGQGFRLREGRESSAFAGIWAALETTIDRKCSCVTKFIPIPLHPKATICNVNTRWSPAKYEWRDNTLSSLPYILVLQDC